MINLHKTKTSAEKRCFSAAVFLCFLNAPIILKSYATFFFQKQFHDDIVGNHTQRQSKRNQKLRRRKWCCTEHGTAKINNAKLYTNDHGHDDDKCTILP